MSRIGKLPIIVPANVDINYDGLEIIVKGKFGTLKTKIPDTIKVQLEEKLIKISTSNTTQNTKALHGLYRTLINNMVVGVSEQFKLTLVLKGVGYRAAVQGDKIVLNLGYSHPVTIKIPENVVIDVVKNTTLNLKSCDKELLGLFASNIRAWRKPEPYKGKGVLYQNEQVSLKAGKSGK